MPSNSDSTFRRITRLAKHSQEPLYVALREALREKGIDISRGAIADFCPESQSMENGAPTERHHVVVVDVEKRAFVGMMERDAISGKFVAWHEVPSTPIPDRYEIVVRTNRNRREKVAWNTGIDNPLITHVRDVLYNQQIEDAMGFLDEP